MVPLALVNRHGLQALDQPQLLGVLTQQDQQRMVGAGIYGLTQVLLSDPRRDSFGFAAVTHPKHQSAASGRDPSSGKYNRGVSSATRRSAKVDTDPR
jgi:hypothetical protein